MVVTAVRYVPYPEFPLSEMNSTKVSNPTKPTGGVYARELMSPLIAVILPVNDRCVPDRVRSAEVN